MPQARGRPPKFGRPARTISVTLPEDILERLARLHPDPAWAIVKLVERLHGPAATVPQAQPPAELLLLPRRRALIVVEPRHFQNLRGVSTVPMDERRAFLSLEAGKGIADLELAIIDRLNSVSGPSPTRDALLYLSQLLKGWRTTRPMTFRSRAIVVAERVTPRAMTDRPRMALGLGRNRPDAPR
jgi:hypothetical protein